MRFAVDIRYTRLPWKYRRRVGFRNSRLENSGFVNYERLWRNYERLWRISSAVVAILRASQIVLAIWIAPSAARHRAS